jgi:hypothetical protein
MTLSLYLFIGRQFKHLIMVNLERAQDVALGEVRWEVRFRELERVKSVQDFHV